MIFLHIWLYQKKIGARKIQQKREKKNNFKSSTCGFACSMCLSQGCIKLYTGGRQPILAVQEGPDSELSGLGVRKTGPVTGPSNPLVHAGSRPSILILPIKYAAGWVLPADPFLPPHGLQECSDVRLHNHRGGKLLPWPTQVSGGG